MDKKTLAEKQLRDKFHLVSFCELTQLRQSFVSPTRPASGGYFSNGLPYPYWGDDRHPLLHSKSLDRFLLALGQLFGPNFWLSPEFLA